MGGVQPRVIAIREALDRLPRGLRLDPPHAVFGVVIRPPRRRAVSERLSLDSPSAVIFVEAPVHRVRRAVPHGEQVTELVIQVLYAERRAGWRGRVDDVGNAPELVVIRARLERLPFNDPLCRRGPPVHIVFVEGLVPVRAGYLGELTDALRRGVPRPCRRRRLRALLVGALEQTAYRVVGICEAPLRRVRGARALPEAIVVRRRRAAVRVDVLAEPPEGVSLERRHRAVRARHCPQLGEGPVGIGGHPVFRIGDPHRPAQRVLLDARHRAARAGDLDRPLDIAVRRRGAPRGDVLDDAPHLVVRPPVVRSEHRRRGLAHGHGAARHVLAELIERDLLHNARRDLQARLHALPPGAHCASERIQLHHVIREPRRLRPELHVPRVLVRTAVFGARRCKDRRRPVRPKLFC